MGRSRFFLITACVVLVLWNFALSATISGRQEPQDVNFEALRREVKEIGLKKSWLHVEDIMKAIARGDRKLNLVFKKDSIDDLSSFYKCR